ncbi:rfaE bifunctional protein kinase chain/domain/rfaE bifunctional protein nucleotidyltransferase chain/domain [Arthrobacter sp. SLBN-100]|uniref:D-glycero-beta-D-manno-heptose 1-phosphate adenylyltransferase n=1 Tax=Arthrobacter sp. SLBN-100 TaxID=2768450 RepID=UPI001150F2BA|nr:D-glycero-beta-D-manno-heptose 1-phosphate adenylyltransferase [Arthrobacter sp. SLBN-100]TQJ69171.1 rfaE bifunctional protein kinase chain/domain/rfaE bifunctional protein nucleotidyltransferase chain/domain [Arthrobacter sp. SLBN-100]
MSLSPDNLPVDPADVPAHPENLPLDPALVDPALADLGSQRALSEWLPGRLAAEEPGILVIGDLMLDGWWSGSIERLCREAPAPVVDIHVRESVPGGAANTAMNLAALGARVSVAGIIGTDDAGEDLRSQLVAAGIDVAYLHSHPDMVTTTKIRISSGGQVMLRLDDSATTVPAEALAALAASVRAAVERQDAVLVCDYGNGVLADPVRKGLIEALGKAPVPGGDRPLLVVDSHDPRPWAPLRPDLVTPNAQETARMLDLRLPDGQERVDAVSQHAEELLEATGAGAVVVTLDRDGTVLLRPDGVTHRTWARPAAEKQASGAGDTFVAALTLARSAGLPLTASLDLAQSAADVVVHQPGTSVCSTGQLSRYLKAFADTALGADELERQLELHRSEGQRIVLTNGCFDVLHSGHTRYLNQAKQLGDVLVVALNSDDSVRKLKGAGRPINSMADRAAVVAALSCVDYVTVFDTPTAAPLIRQLRPEVYAKGGDYTPEMLAETPAVEEYGGRVAILDYVAERSTTAVVKRIREGEGAVPGN